MINSTHLYLVLSSLVALTILYLFFNFRSTKNNLNNKVVLKNLLESFDLELPEELKRLENSSTEPQKFQ
tara:strand:- start:1152 stop:1358 length:207 start_codon:yes stop_codon:yes gene_type:complete